MSLVQRVREYLQPSTPQLARLELPDWHWTKDQWVLEQHLTQLLFVPDAMRTGGKNHELLKSITPGGEPSNPSCYTHVKFLGYKRDLGEHSDALIMPGDFQPSGFIARPPPPSKVQGELYSVYAGQIYLLDKLKQNGVMFTRQRVKITYPWRYVSYGREHPLPKITPHCFVTIVAWMYVGVPRYWDPLIGGVLAKPLNLYEHDPPRPWVGEYYRFDV